MRERMTLPDAILEIARSQIDVHESGGPNAGMPSLRYMGGRQEPWCAWFVLWVLREAGAPYPGDPGRLDGKPCALAGVAHLERVGREHDWIVSAPYRGDLIVFRRRGASDAGPGMHVGIVERVSPNSGAVSTIEGNSGDAVRRVHYSRERLPLVVSSYIRRPEPEGWAYSAPPLGFPR
jgi:hypothetical protein